MGTYLVREGLRRVSTLLQDRNPQFKRWTEQQLVDYGNDACAAIAKYVPTACSRLGALKLAPGSLQDIALIGNSRFRNPDGSFPNDDLKGNSLIKVVQNMGADGASPGRMLRLVEQAALDANDPYWATPARAQPTTREYTYDPTVPRMFLVNPPVPATGSVWVTVVLNTQPDRIPDGAKAGVTALYDADGAGAGVDEVLPIADVHMDDWVNYVVARANMQDSEWADGTKAAAFASMFMSSINQQAAALTGINPNLQRLPFSPVPQGSAR